MFKKFADLEIDFWIHDVGHGVSPFMLCMQASTDKMGPVLEAVDELLAEDVPARRALTFKPGNRERSITRLVIQTSATGDNLLEMFLSCDVPNAEFEFTTDGLKRFRECVCAWMEGGTDFCLAPDEFEAKRHRKRTKTDPKDLSSETLWFWSQFMDP